MSATNTGKSQINLSILVHLHVYISVYSKYKFPAKLLHLATKIEKKKLETFKPGKYLLAGQFPKARLCLPVSHI